MEENNKKYQISLVLRKETDYEKITTILRKHGASTGDKKEIARLRLSYPLKKEAFGYFGEIAFEAKPEEIKGIESDLKTEADILRFMILNAPPLQYASVKGEKSRTISKQTERPLREAGSAQEHKKVEHALKEEEKKRPKPSFEGELSNEALEKKLEEILK